jgi:hypothetical protein
MTCPLCGARRSRRACPAVGRDICPVCCGTKRLAEIQCPDSCGYLRTAQAHPPAVLARQRERDARFVMPMVHQLSERAYTLLLLLQQVIRRHSDGAIPAINDQDVAEAAAALAATLETSARGIIYDHQPASLPAQRLLSDLKAALNEVVQASGQASRVERDGAVALRRIEKAARGAREVLAPSDSAYLGLLGRLPEPADREVSLEGSAVPGPQDGPNAGSPRLVIP